MKRKIVITISIFWHNPLIKGAQGMGVICVDTSASEMVPKVVIYWQLHWFHCQFSILVSVCDFTGAETDSGLARSETNLTKASDNLTCLDWSLWKAVYLLFISIWKHCNRSCSMTYLCKLITFKYVLCNSCFGFYLIKVLINWVLFAYCECIF